MKKWLLLVLLSCLPIYFAISKIEFDTISFISNDDLLIAKMLHHEACNDTELNRRGLVHLVYNRVSKGKLHGYENTVEGVLTQSGQFQGYLSWPKPCQKCICSTISARNDNPLISKEITHYLSKWDTKQEHIIKVKVLQTLGGHQFGIYIWNKKY